MKFIKGNGVTGYSGTESGNKFLNCAGHNFIAEYNDNFGSFQYPNCKCFKYRYNTYNLTGEIRQNTGYGYFKNNNLAETPFNAFTTHNKLLLTTTFRFLTTLLNFLSTKY